MNNSDSSSCKKSCIACLIFIILISYALTPKSSKEENKEISKEEEQFNKDKKMSFDFREESIGSGIKFFLSEDGKPVTYAECMKLLKESRSFR